MNQLMAREFTSTQAARVSGIRGSFSDDGYDFAPYLIAGAFILFFALMYMMNARQKKIKTQQPQRRF